MRISDYENRLKQIDSACRKSNLNLDELPELITELKELYHITENPISKLIIYTLESIQHFTSKNKSELLKSATNAYEMAKELQIPYYEIRSYSMLGTYYNISDNILLSFNYNLKALNLLNDYESSIEIEEYISLFLALQNNIGCCYITMEQYKEAIYHFLSVYKSIDSITATPRQLRLYTLACRNIVICYYYLKNKKEAYRWIEKIMFYIDSPHLTNDFRHDVLLLKYLIENQLGNEVNISLLLNEIGIDHITEIQIETLFELIRFLLELKEYDTFLLLYHILLDKLEKQNDISNHIKLLRFYADFCKDTKDTKNYDFIYQEVGKLSFIRDQQIFAEQKESFQIYIEVTQNLKRQKGLEERIEQLEHRSESDALTGVANRYKLTEFFQYAYLKAMSEQLYLAVIIIDVDYFKQINDNYGHNHGDYCLRKLAEEFEKSITNPELELCARYGGDEFIIVKLGQSDDEILEGMIQLQQSVMELAIPNEYSKVSSVITISQGAINQIPTETDTLQSFLNIADEGLYEAKKVSKNTVVLQKLKSKNYQTDFINS